ncbi:MAG: Lrp/AsnC family transcriptional regulator of ectoine degradation [Candidatus Pseudothioglobus sp.]|jgi:Lrp/AsnC family transcriptional regulator of ectoine degradation|tara:strand:+ start:254 stop:727 length:474 start_codon:yes stop_codon:yes gene_type:complete
MSLLKLDAIDIHILATVQEYGRMSKTALAEKVNLSATPCWTRLNRLENAGIIRGYHAEIAFELIAKMTTVILEVSLKRHRHEDFEIFEKRINELDEIVECIATGGGVDYILKMVVPSIDEYQKLVDALLLENLGIDRYFTYIVTREIKSSKPKLTTI